ncbi:MAG: hypothetical protein ACKN9V_03680 [Pseudomonadota bacterium]
MRFSASCLVVVVSFLGLISFADEPPCRSIEWVRLETSRDVERMKDVCEVRQSLAIFVDGVTELSFPRLKRAGLINVESHGLEALAFPKLEQARDIYLTGADLKVAEFPKLNIVSSRLVVQERNVQFLNFPNLKRVGRLILQSCLNLEFVFADKLYDVASIRLEGNPALSPASAENLKSVTRVMSPEEMAYVQNAQEEMRLFRRRLLDNALNQPPIRPTGHPTHFDSFGFIKSYYEWYPYEYNRYWSAIGPWGYWLFFNY